MKYTILRFIVDQQVEDIEMPENLKLNTFLQEFPLKTYRIVIYVFDRPHAKAT